MNEARLGAGLPAGAPSSLRWLTPFLALWGVHGIGAAAVEFFEVWIDLRWLAQALFIGAVLISLLLWLRVTRRTSAVRSSSITIIMLAFPAAMLIGAVAALEYVQAVGPFFTPLLRSFLLSVVYVLLGTAIDKRLFWLGLWLFTLTVIIALWYLGYSGVILQGMSGLSLLVCAWSLSRTQSRVSAE
ncbi:hypothetical protein [Paenibacillus sp. FJAT-26967]|uniref:hypothetical protein n=1 Tax=Paenibacillus sp. FJAT-26967 TaxID=1729690 RepID=UPI0008385DAB|nr:hypothetical protein [Paenibacillus sp. FJAT-26967]